MSDLMVFQGEICDLCGARFEDDSEAVALMLRQLAVHHFSRGDRKYVGSEHYPAEEDISFVHRRCLNESGWHQVIGKHTYGKKLYAMCDDCWNRYNPAESVPHRFASVDEAGEYTDRIIPQICCLCQKQIDGSVIYVSHNLHGVLNQDDTESLLKNPGARGWVSG